MRAIAIALLAAAASRGLAKCTDDKKWRYVRGPEENTFAPKSCKDVAEKPDARCDRVSDDGVSARYACCATCAEYDCAAETKQPIFFQAGEGSWKGCKKTCEKRGLAMPCITSKKDVKKLQEVIPFGAWRIWLGYTTDGKDPLKPSNWKWRDGCESTFTSWGADQPDNGAPWVDDAADDDWWEWDEFCAYHADPEWFDRSCDSEYDCFCQNDDPCALAGKSGKGGGKAPSKAKCKKDDKTWRDKDDGTTCKGIKKIKDKKARKKACKLKGENADGEIVTAKEACCKKA
eukprot:CAMPEP_0119267394 /NCGR_PEP_ID=MMETSP1329-20130426/5553_1 /TAXON_ID=114041 /ORGANISM="Genus nov. species nov., Strain RCC1024" /LENGTH=287 /DNA_ID=CAMNT_0007267315 /DNA_START=178 /DNA_END=1038 /DNA_ORIENTATION=-